MLAKKEGNDIYVYYQVSNVGEDIDVRYVRENGFRLGEYDPLHKLYLINEGKFHELNELLGTKFSVFQSIYSIPEIVMKTKIEKDIFPHLDEIINEENLKSIIIKYNPTERLFYSPKRTSNVIWLYEYQKYKENYYSIDMIKPILIRNKKVYLSN